jgi:hypothetical protein
MKKPREMTCEEFTARMPELVATGADVFAHPHVKKCSVHRDLLRDLEAIARAAQQLIPDVDPSDRVWAGIEGKIGLRAEPDERVSDPFPGFHLVVRVKVMENWNQQTDLSYDEQLGERNLPVPGMRIRGGHRSPPHPKEGR